MKLDDTLDAEDIKKHQEELSGVISVLMLQLGEKEVYVGKKIKNHEYHYIKPRYDSEHPQNNMDDAANALYGIHGKKHKSTPYIMIDFEEFKDKSIRIAPLLKPIGLMRDYCEIAMINLGGDGRIRLLRNGYLSGTKPTNALPYSSAFGFDPRKNFVVMATEYLDTNKL